MSEPVLIHGLFLRCGCKNFLIILIIIIIIIII